MDSPLEIPIWKKIFNGDNNRLLGHGSELALDDLLEIREAVLQNYFKNTLNNYLQLKQLFININKYFYKKTLTIENQVNVLHRVKSEQEV